LVRDRVDPGGVNLLLISGRQAAFGPLLWGSYLACRSVSTIESFQIGPPRTLEPTERFDPHPYQTGSKEEVRIRKDVVEDTEVVEEDVRREEIDIEDETKRRGV
jgi:hypothetical protein